jgi:serine/threonine protein kinase
VTPSPHAQASSRRNGLRYERLFLLGSGGMATVHLAMAVGPSGFNRLVVVKSMLEELSVQSDTHQMFLAEARLSARLNHPNVVQVSEVVEAPDGIMLVMEYLDGVPLSQVSRVAGDAFTLSMRLRAICEVLAGLHYAHELADYKGRPLGIVHRDVSPQNVFVTYDGRVKLLDFGIAKATNSEQTQTGLVKGRIAYMPAEQLTANQVDRRTDIYAVGCVLWELVAGNRLWANVADREILRNVIAGNVPALSSRVEVDPELEAIVTRATALDPAARYPDADAMRSDLERCLSRIAVPVTARDIGEMLSRVCAKAREERQRAIAEATAKIDLSAPTSGEHSAVDSASFNRLRVPSISRGSGTMLSVQMGAPRSGDYRVGTLVHAGSPISVREMTPGEATPPSSRSASGKNHSETRSSVRVTVTRPGLPRWAFAGLALVALGGLAAAGLFFGRRATLADNPSATPTPAAPSVVSRSLTVDATPRDARIFVDGQSVDGNPAVLNVPSGSEHVVRVEREGYEPNERRIQVKDSLTMTLNLAPAEATAPPSSTSNNREDEAKLGESVRSRGAARGAPRGVGRVPHATAPRALASSPAREPATDCDPPFYFKGGIKTYKPGCI